MNGLRHGIRSQLAAVLPHEDPAEVRAYREMVRRELGCVGELECEIGHCIADLRWKERRIEEIEARRQEIEVLHRLDDTSERNSLGLMNAVLGLLDAMTRAMESRLPESREELDQLVAPMRAVVRMLSQVEGGGPEVLVGADGLATAIETLTVLSTESVHPLAWGEVIERARSSAHAVRELLPDVEKKVETVKKQLAMGMPLPWDRDVSLRVRYRRDIEKRLETEMRFLMQLQERRRQARDSGSLGGARIPTRPSPPSCADPNGWPMAVRPLAGPRLCNQDRPPGVTAFRGGAL